MKIEEDSLNYKYLKDTIITKNLESEVIDDKLVLNINKQEMSLKNVETYNIATAMRNSSKCTFNAGQTYFTRLLFKGKINLYKNEMQPTVTLGSENLANNNSIRSLNKNQIIGSGYSYANYGLHFFREVTYQDNIGWLPGHYDTNLQNTYLYIYGPGVVGMINVSRNMTLYLDASSSTITSNDGNRNLRFWKADENNNIDTNDEVLLEFDGTNRTIFKLRLTPGVYYIRQSGAATYYSATVMYDDGGLTTARTNFANTLNVPASIFKIYKFDEENLRFSLIAQSDNNNNLNKQLTTVNQNYIDGDGIYYLAVYNPYGNNEVMGMNCDVASNVTPWIGFGYNGDSPNNFYAWEENVRQTYQTFSASIETINYN